jgi:tRNA (cmo5U34)-methyltransferase
VKQSKHKADYDAAHRATELPLMVNLWTSSEHALNYLAIADAIPHRVEGEGVLLYHVPKTVRRILDLGTGSGRLLSLLKIERPQAECIGLDFSPAMLAAAQEQFANDGSVHIQAHNLDEPLPELGQFDAVVSSFAIHHLNHDRKRSLYSEIFARLTPGGIFCNLEHVASPTERLHQQFREALGISDRPDDPSNKLLDVETQLQWLRDIGFDDVDCYWKWLELALLIGVKPAI